MGSSLRWLVWNPKSTHESNFIRDSTATGVHAWLLLAELKLGFRGITWRWDEVKVSLDSLTPTTVLSIMNLQLRAVRPTPSPSLLTWLSGHVPEWFSSADNSHLEPENPYGHWQTGAPLDKRQAPPFRQCSWHRSVSTAVTERTVEQISFAVNSVVSGSEVLYFKSKVVKC